VTCQYPPRASTLNSHPLKSVLGESLIQPNNEQEQRENKRGPQVPTLV